MHMQIEKSTQFVMTSYFLNILMLIDLPAGVPEDACAGLQNAEYLNGTVLRAQLQLKRTRPAHLRIVLRKLYSFFDIWSVRLRSEASLRRFRRTARRDQRFRMGCLF